MKKQFDREKIVRELGLFRERFPRQIVNVNGKNIEYFVMPGSLTDLRNFAYRNTGNCPEYVLGVSEDVPEDFRVAWMFHEYAEYVEGLKCVDALAEELKLIPENRKGEYLLLRRRFFRDLVEYCTNAGTYDLDVIKEFEESRDRLDVLCDEL